MLLAIRSSTAAAATATFTLETSVPGEFKVFAQVSQGDNGGLVTYGIPLLGNITSIDHVSPNIALAENTAQEIGPAAFTYLRSPDGDPEITGAQVIVPEASPNVVYGFGQTAGSFAALGITSLGPPPEQPAWDAKLLIAEGTYTGRIDFDRANVNLLADVFVSAGNPLPVDSADLILQNDSYTPEPYGIDVDLGQRQRFPFPLVTHRFQAIGDRPMTWSDLLHEGPPVGNTPTLSSSGLFRWDVGNAGLGVHTFNVMVTNAFGTDVAQLTISIVPEPSTTCLAFAAAVGAAGLARQQHCDG
jgi:hypothetical protein